MHGKIVILLLLISLNGYCLKAQNSYVPAFRAHYGFIIPHSKSLRPVTKTKPYGFEAEWNWQLMSRNAWNYCYCYPRTGLSFFFIDFSNPEILGHAFATYFFIEPVLGAERKWHGAFRFGIGPSFMDKIYDEQTNPQNTLYSSHLSFIVMLTASLNYRLNDVMNLRLQSNYNHISNGGLKNPNKGINFPTVSLGLDYNIRPRPFEMRVKNDTLDLNPKKNRFQLAVFGSAKTDIKGQQHFAVLGIYGNYTRVVGRLSGISLGLELTTDLADKHEVERLDLTTDGKKTDHNYGAVLAGHDLLIGRFNLKIQLGVYFYSPFERLDPVYQRYGLNFQITEHMYTGINIKAHRHVADFLDLRFGYAF